MQSIVIGAIAQCQLRGRGQKSSHERKYSSKQSTPAKFLVETHPKS